MNEEKEITIGQLFFVCKKSLLKALIYILASVLLTTCVLFVVKSFTNTNIYTSTITLKQTDDGTLNAMNAYKGTAVVNALDKVYPDDSDKVLSLSKDISGALTITADFPSDLDDGETFVPTTFHVNLKNVSKLDVSSSEYAAILDAIDAELIGTFSSKSFPSLLYTVNVENQLSVLEYIQVVDELLDTVNNYITSINSYVSVNSSSLTYNGTVSGKNISNILNDLTAIKSNLENVQFSIITNKIEITENAISEYLTLAITNAENSNSKYEAMATAAKENLINFPSSITSSSSATSCNTYVQIDGSSYNELAEQVIKYTELAQDALSQKTSLELLKTKIGSSSASVSKEQIATALKTSGNNVAKAINDYTTLSNEYNIYKGASSSAKILSPAKATVESVLSTKLILVIDVVVLLIAFIVAYTQTFGKFKKQGFFDKDLAENK